MRHPFERLVSAFQNKVGFKKTDVSQWAIYEKNQVADNERQLWAEYRALISAQIGDTSFQSFVKWLASKINQVVLVFTEVIRTS